MKIIGSKIIKEDSFFKYGDPYSNVHPHNALRLGLNLAKRENVHVKVFLTADGVLCVRWGQKTPDIYYNLEGMLKSIAKRGEAST